MLHEKQALTCRRAGGPRWAAFRSFRSMVWDVLQTPQVERRKQVVLRRTSARRSSLKNVFKQASGFSNDQLWFSYEEKWKKNSDGRFRKTCPPLWPKQRPTAAQYRGYELPQGLQNSTAGCQQGAASSWNIIVHNSKLQLLTNLTLFIIKTIFDLFILIYPEIKVNKIKTQQTFCVEYFYSSSIRYISANNGRGR